MASETRIFKIKESINITDEVIAIIAGLAATEVEGVASLEGNLKNKAIEKAGINKLSKGVKVIPAEDGSITIRLSINTEYGHEIQAVCVEVQEKVKSTVENMTGMKVGSIDVRIASVVLDTPQ